MGIRVPRITGLPCMTAALISMRSVTFDSGPIVPIQDAGMVSGLFLRYSCGQMRLAAALACFVCLGFAQSSATVDAIRYPRLAEFAVVQGDVLMSGGKV